jgi:Tfp pilus assembly protein PilX
MKPLRRKLLSKRLGSALVMTLVIIVLITVVTVGYLASVMLETKTAGAGLDQERAYGIAMIGVHEAMSRVRDALGPWDDPYKNFATNAPPFYWSLSPGRITRWPYSSASPTNFALFSESGGTNLVNLNRALADGSHPIIGQTNVGQTNPPDVSVKWANVLRDPSQTASSNNAIIGRYAFWVDDEGAKININTADGTEKYTTNSLGIGSPSEVSLEVLVGGTNGRAASKEIVQIARTRGFHSPREILSATNVALAVYSDNVFALTTQSRSPDLNIFGQPKMALVPILGAPEEHSTNMVINGITLGPAQEIYPTPSQLPPYRVVNPVPPNNVDFRSWPLAFRAEQGKLTLGRGNDFGQGSWFYTLENYCYINGQMLANYLAGTNAAGQQIKWPPFPASSSTGFAGKYTPRQIDSIVAQIVSLGSKAISADYPYPLSSDYPGLNVTPPSEDVKINGGGGVLELAGCRYHVAPYIFPGWLSGQWVIGMGRAPKVNRILLRFATFGSQGTLGQTNYIPPKLQTDIWVESWLPAAYMGGKEVIAPQGLGRIFGTAIESGALNCSDMQRDGSKPAALRKANGIDPSYWANQILTTDKGIDFNANPPDRDDPDPPLAALFHDPFALRKNADGTRSPPYQGTGQENGKFTSPLLMSPAQSQAEGKEWAPGELRCVRNRYGEVGNYTLPMQTTADGATLQIRGGISVRGEIVWGWFSDPDPVPLEAIRGPNPADTGSTEMLTGEPWSTSLRDRHIASVIPVTVDIPVPPGGVLTGPTKYVYAKTADPLVNKFPGDWKPIVSDTQPSPSMVWQAALPNQFSSYDEMNINFRAELADPDSYWMPQADCAVSTKADLASQTLIPRSARMPNVGYLQYVRTGIMPDDESVAYENQHGTPFRLLSFAPSTDTANQKTTWGGSAAYPDWAMLDLLYVPSTLTPFGGSYHVSTNLAYYGTFGGATSGRINPNGAVIYTTNVNVPQAGVTRTLPMQAVFQGVKVNQTLSGSSGTNASFTGGSDVPSGVAQAVADYIRNNGPLRMPAEICNIQDIANLRAPNNPTRNDLVRQVVGSLTTQGNVFSVWTVGQVIQKKQANTLYGEFESGDNVQAEVRLRFVVERYLDPGADGVYGNSANPGTDTIVGSLDDPGIRENATYDINHPSQPRYLYRVISSEEIR